MLRYVNIVIRSGGELASGVAHRLFRSHLNKICITEIERPLAVRRLVSFCEAIYIGEKVIEGVKAVKIDFFEKIQQIWETGNIPILIDEYAEVKEYLKPDILIDAIIAKRNTGTKITDAKLVIGLGPGFCAGKDVHVVIETNRGHNLGSIITNGEAEPNTSIPGSIMGYTENRVLYSPTDGIFKPFKEIGDKVQKDDLIAMVNDKPIHAKISGIIRGLLRQGLEIKGNTKVGDIDPRGILEYCFNISDKARAIAGGVLETILWRFN